MLLTGTVDGFSGLAPLLRVRPELQNLCHFGEQWASPHAPETGGWAPFHFVTHGQCVIDLHGTERSITLSTGDAAILPHGSRHTVRGPDTQPDARGPFGIRSIAHGDIVVKTNTDGEPATQLICGRLRFEQAHDNLVLAALPEAIVVSATSDAAVAARLRTLMFTIRDELEGAGPGAGAIATDLASAMFVMVVRNHLARTGSDAGLLGLLAHPQAGRAVAAMLGEPARNWTLDELAERANASRASLVRMFQKAARFAPLAFLTELRLDLGRCKLAATTLAVAAIAAEVGYKSESAFSRAFHRRFDLRPGDARGSAATSSPPSGAAIATERRPPT
jgi:AraC family transcriptional activator of mtrCDE